MPVEVRDGGGSNLFKVDTSWLGGRIAIYPQEALGHYRMCATSGVLTGVAAGTATAGILFAVRAPATNTMVVQRIKVKLWTIVQPTATLETWLKIIQLSGYSASITGGTTISLASPQFKKMSGYPDTTIQSASIATTAGLTAGTHTMNTNEFCSEGRTESAAAEATSPNLNEMEFLGNETGEHGMVFVGNQGFVVRNEILWSAAQTGRMSVTLDWFERTSPTQRW